MQGFSAVTHVYFLNDSKQGKMLIGDFSGFCFISVLADLRFRAFLQSTSKYFISVFFFLIFGQHLCNFQFLCGRLNLCFQIKSMKVDICSWCFSLPTLYKSKLSILKNQSVLFHSVNHRSVSTLTTIWCVNCTCVAANQVLDLGNIWAHCSMIPLSMIISLLNFWLPLFS